jgi:hypothetical protein
MDMLIFLPVISQITILQYDRQYYLLLSSRRPSCLTSDVDFVMQKRFLLGACGQLF